MALVHIRARRAGQLQWELAEEVQAFQSEDLLRRCNSPAAKVWECKISWIITSCLRSSRFGGVNIAEENQYYKVQYMELGAMELVSYDLIQLAIYTCMVCLLNSSLIVVFFYICMDLFTRNCKICRKIHLEAVQQDQLAMTVSILSICLCEKFSVFV